MKLIAPSSHFRGVSLSSPTTESCTFDINFLSVRCDSVLTVVVPEAGN